MLFAESPRSWHVCEKVEQMRKDPTPGKPDVLEEQQRHGLCGNFAFALGWNLGS